MQVNVFTLQDSFGGHFSRCSRQERRSGQFAFSLALDFRWRRRIHQLWVGREATTNCNPSSAPPWQSLNPLARKWIRKSGAGCRWNFWSKSSLFSLSRPCWIWDQPVSTSSPLYSLPRSYPNTPLLLPLYLRFSCCITLCVSTTSLCTTLSFPPGATFFPFPIYYPGNRLLSLFSPPPMDSFASPSPVHPPFLCATSWPEPQDSLISRFTLLILRRSLWFVPLLGTSSSRSVLGLLRLPLLFTIPALSSGGNTTDWIRFRSTIISRRAPAIMGVCTSRPQSHFQPCALIWRVGDGRGPILNCPASSHLSGWWPAKVNCIWSAESGLMGFHGAWNCGNWLKQGIGWRWRDCRRWCVGNFCRFVTTTTSMFIAFGIRGGSVFAAIHGRRFCITRFQGGPGIGCPNALTCPMNGAAGSSGFLLFQSCMLLSNSVFSFLLVLCFRCFFILCKYDADFNEDLFEIWVLCFTETYFYDSGPVSFSQVSLEFHIKWICFLRPRWSNAMIIFKWTVQIWSPYCSKLTEIWQTQWTSHPITQAKGATVRSTYSGEESSLIEGYNSLIHLLCSVGIFGGLLLTFSKWPYTKSCSVLRMKSWNKKQLTNF